MCTEHNNYSFISIKHQLVGNHPRFYFCYTCLYSWYGIYCIILIDHDINLCIVRVEVVTKAMFSSNVNILRNTNRNNVYKTDITLFNTLYNLTDLMIHSFDFNVSVHVSKIDTPFFFFLILPQYTSARPGDFCCKSDTSDRAKGSNPKHSDLSAAKWLPPRCPAGQTKASKWNASLARCWTIPKDSIYSTVK